MTQYAADYLREHAVTCWRCDQPATTVMTLDDKYDPAICPALCNACAALVALTKEPDEDLEES